MSHWTDQIRCPICGSDMDIYEKYWLDTDQIRVSCNNEDCRFRVYFKDADDMLTYFFPSGIPSSKHGLSSNRTRAWRRRTDVTKALRKRSITQHYWSSKSHPYYPNLHQFSKNKIHCSCPMCSSKTNNRWNYGPRHNYKISDLRRKLSMDQDEIDSTSRSEE